MNERPAFDLVVCGAAGVPEALVFDTLDHLTRHVRATHHLCLVCHGDADGAPLTAWAKRWPGEVTCAFVPVLPTVYGRFAEPRAAMLMVATAKGVVIFGPERRWWRVVRYAKEIGLPVRVVTRPPPRPASEWTELPPEAGVLRMPG